MQDMTPQERQWADEANMQDMTPQKRQWADVHGEQRDSRRCTKTGKAFQNYRRAMLHILRGMVNKEKILHDMAQFGTGGTCTLLGGFDLDGG
jgi:hypothetical protein